MKNELKIDERVKNNLNCQNRIKNKRSQMSDKANNRQLTKKN